MGYLRHVLGYLKLFWDILNNTLDISFTLWDISDRI
jgi:hypothetical protein